MALSEAQEKARKEDEKVKYLMKCICNKNGDKDYVFISYKSDDWEIVLKDIVYRLVTEHGLNVYFDGDFSVNNPHWTTQFPANMEDKKCKGILIFLDDKYATSYATLMELMHSQFGCQDEDEGYKFIKKPVVPINLVKTLSVIKDDSDTGLGKTTYYNGEKEVKNIKAKDEKELFDEDFEEGCESKVIKKAKKPYLKKQELSKELCSIVVEEVLRSIDYNDNFYNGNLDTIVSSIKSVCGKTVFSKEENADGGKINEYGIVITNGDMKSTLRVKEGDLIPKQVSGIKEGFEFEGWLWKYSAKQAVSYLEWDGESKNCIVKKGSQVAAEANGFAKLAAATLKNSLLKEGVIVGDRFVVDYPCDKISTIINVLYGGSVNMQKEKREGKLRKSDGTIEPEPDSGPIGSGPDPTSKFEYLLWNEQHSANKLTDLMHDVFDLIAEKYPDKIQNIADSDNITSVARKDKLDQGKIQGSKASQFAHFKSKEHSVNGVIYCVNTGYNREGGLGQLKKMLVLCEGNSDGFQITKAPEKSSHSGGKTGKKGLDELLNSK